MLQLEHINLVVNDMPAALRFYQAAFPHWRIREQGEGPWYGKPRKWLHLGDDYQYLTLNDNGEGESRDLAGHQPGLAHFGFVTHNLDALVERMRAAGFEISHTGAEEVFRRNVYFVDPSGMEIEFVEYISDMPAQRNLSGLPAEKGAAQ